jgi:hypothetical protein
MNPITRIAQTLVVSLLALTVGLGASASAAVTAGHVTAHVSKKQGKRKKTKRPKTAPRPVRGPHGRPGDRGLDGVNGRNGADGKEGAPGVQGSPGLPGLQGPSGAAAPISALAHRVATGPGANAAGPSNMATAIATCAVGQWAVGGGYELSGVNSSVFPQLSAPSADGTGWRVQTISTLPGPYAVTPYVVCVG